MQYSPKLKKVMEEIKDLLKKNDVAGIVVLHNLEGEPQITEDGFTHVQGFTEFLFHINTSYSAARFEKDRFEVRGKAVHYKSKQERDAKMAGAVNMLEHLGEWSGKMCMQAGNMIEILSQVAETVRDENHEGPTSHTQNN